MRSKLMLLAVFAAILAIAPCPAGSAVGPQAYVDVWTDRGEGEIYNRGEAIDIYVQASFDAYVIVYTIDTDGYLNVVFPYDCRDDGFLKGGTTYRIVAGEDDAFYADGSKGVAYVRAVASATPIRRLYWPGCPGYERYADDVAWSSFADYWGPALPRQIYGDPYVAMQSIDEFICWDSVNSGAVSVSYTYYYVMEAVERPVYYVRAGWRWPHTWYWPCSDIYWNVCWDACWDAGWSVGIGIGGYYPYYYDPYRWSWCAPTWCAPSWCWPNWYRPCYASCGSRVTVCSRGTCGSCSGCRGHTVRTYPSQVKYKTGTYAGTAAASAEKNKADERSREYNLYTREDGSQTKSKRLATDQDREGLRKVKPVSSEVERTTADRAVKSKTSQKVYSTEGSRRPADKQSAPEAVEPEKRKAVSPSRAETVKTPDREKSSVKAVTTRKPAAVTKPESKPSTRTTSKSRSQTKVSGSTTAARASTARPSKASSSSSGSSTNRSGSPKTRRSVSR